MTREEAIKILDQFVTAVRSRLHEEASMRCRPNSTLSAYRMLAGLDQLVALEMAKEALENCTDGNLDHVGCDHLNGNMIYVSGEVYERIKNNPDRIIVESQCQAPLFLKVVGWGK